MSHDNKSDARIFIGGLDPDCTEYDLEKAFGMFGDINQVMVLRDRDTNNSRGFAFLSFERPESAEESIRRMHGVEVLGKCVTVRKAQRQSAMQDRPRRGGFRGGRGGERRFDDSRGRGMSNRRPSYDDDRHNTRDSYASDRRGNFEDPRGGYQDSRRGTRESHHGYQEYRRGNYNGSRQTGGYYDETRNRDFKEAPRFETRREEQSYGFDDVRHNHRTEIARSRSPIAKHSSFREESPVPTYKGRRPDSGQYRKEFSPPKRGFSPPPRRREGVREGRDSGGYGDLSLREISPSTRRRAREPSPTAYGASFSDVKRSPMERASYSRKQPSPPVQKRSYASKRGIEELASRSGREPADSREFHSRSRHDADRGPPAGSRYQSSEAPYADRYAMAQSTRQLEGYEQGAKRSSHRSSPPRRSRF